LGNGPRIKFVDFYPGFCPKDNFLFEILAERFGAELSERPQFLIFSVFGSEHLFKYGSDVVKILWTAENARPNFQTCDYALSFDYSDDSRNLRWPLYAYHWRWGLLGGRSLVREEDEDVREIFARKTRFCDFVYSNPSCKMRNDFFELLSRYKRVDSGGALMNNMGGRIAGPDGKLALQGECKFTIAFENASHPGYVTEKIVDPLLARSVPIYWGSPRAAEELNPDCFINAHDYGSMAEVARRVVELDRDDELYLKYLSAPCFPENKMPKCCTGDYVASFFVKIFREGRPRTVPARELMEGCGGWASLV
jgi:hypothetical protein